MTTLDDLHAKVDALTVQVNTALEAASKVDDTQAKADALQVKLSRLASQLDALTARTKT